MHDLKIEAPEGKPVLIITRTFDAPRALVWKAISEPQHAVRWFGPHGHMNEVLKWDWRVGGELSDPFDGDPRPAQRRIPADSWNVHIARCPPRALLAETFPVIRRAVDRGRDRSLRGCDRTSGAVDCGGRLNRGANE